jgi:hypothetical protein
LTVLITAKTLQTLRKREKINPTNCPRPLLLRIEIRNSRF